MPEYFIGAKNVCIMFNPQKPYYNEQLVKYSEQYFGGKVIDWSRKPCSNKIYMHFSIITSLDQLINQIEMQENILFGNFDPCVFRDGVQGYVKIRGYSGHNETNINICLPTIENLNIMHSRISELEKIELTMKDLDIYMEKRLEELICNSNSKHQQEIDTLQYKIKSQENTIYNIVEEVLVNETAKYQEQLTYLTNKINLLEHSMHSIEYVIKHQTSVTSLVLDKIIKNESVITTINKWADFTQDFVNQNSHDISEIKIKLDKNESEKESLNKWAECTQDFVNQNLYDIDEIKIKLDKIDSEKLSLDKWVGCTQDFVNQNCHDIQDIKTKLDKTQSEINETIKSKEDIKQIQNCLKNTDQLLVDLKHSKRWYEQISQCHHQYTLSKFDTLQKEINKFKKENDDKFKEIEKQLIPNKTELQDKLTDFTNNITHIQIPQQTLISLDNLEAPVKQPENKNTDVANEDYDCYDDDDITIIVTRE
jgi:hypothetical protein